MGVFEKIFTALSESTQDTSLLMIDATCLKAHRTAASLRKKGFLSLYRTHKRRIEHQITCSLRLRRTFNSDIADRCYDAGWIRSFLKNRGCTPCIPSRKNAKSQEYYDKKQYRQRHKIENMRWTCWPTATSGWTRPPACRRSTTTPCAPSCGGTRAKGWSSARITPSWTRRTRSTPSSAAPASRTASLTSCS